MTADIITIGDEILIGQTIDTNSAWIAEHLNMEGISIHRILSISDKREEIIRSLDGIEKQVALVIVTGGLGPTSDDITRRTLAEYFNTPLAFNQDVYRKLEARLVARGFGVNVVNRTQAIVPKDCVLLENALGTAPGMWFEKNGRIYISLPGVPYEMVSIMEKEAIPRIRKYFRTPHIEHRNILTFGTYEARLSELLIDFEKDLPPQVRLAYLPSSGIIKLRLSSTEEKLERVKALLDELQEKLVECIKPYVFGFDDATLEKVVGQKLRERNATLSTAESCTGGTIAHMITSVPGSSDYFKGTIVAYSNEVKEKLLGVPQTIMQKHGAVSREVVEAMALGIQELLHTDYAIATSGIAGPAGGTTDKPVGTVWIAVAGKEGTLSELFHFGHSRTQNIHRSSLTALNMLRLFFQAEKQG
jgi:competence/damage-inducible protein CinA-like protein